MARSAAAAHEHGPHLVLGRYRPVRPLGAGGSGTVWLARDVIADRDVALKIVAREGKAGERARREALAVARLRTRHCARAYAVERDERHVYVVYEYVPGKTMREAIRAGELDDAATVEAAAQILDALAHAHRRGVVHRDVKPSNVLLADDDGVSIRLLDFGLALMEEEDTLTAQGDVPGTLAYISPERLDGDPATGAADVWAVGVILWESLAGYQPFWSASPVETARLIASGPPSLAKARPDLPRSLTAAVDRALALDPQRRPAPERLADELRRSRAEAVRRREPRSILSRPILLERAAGALAAAGFVCLATVLLPFFPTVLIALLSILAALVALASPRAGLALALAVPVLPLGNVSLGLALAYLPLAALWLTAFWRDARHALLFTAGPVLALAGLLPLAPLVCERAAGWLRRFLQGWMAVTVAATVAGLRGNELPLTGESPPSRLGIGGSESVSAVAGTIWGVLTEHPALLVEALVVGAVAALLPAARRYGLWGLCGLAAAYAAAGILGPTLAGTSGVSQLAILASCWIVVAVQVGKDLLALRTPQVTPVQ